MPPQLLDLPDELLDAALSELLPPRARSKQPRYSIDDTPNVDSLTDLVRMTAVCQSLRKLALPWVCRRVNIYMEESPSDIDPPSFWILLENNPDLARYTQSFTLDISGAFSDTLCAEFTGLLPAIRRMNNLRVVSFVCEPYGPLEGPNHAIMTEIFSEVTSKPHLHTLLSNHCAPTKLPHLPALKHLCCLRLENFRIEELLALGPCIESLMIVDNPSCIIPIPKDIPWETLREISVQNESDINGDGWVAILDSFSEWNQKFPDIRSPLEEIAMDVTRPISDEQIEDLLTTFQGQSLHTLILSTIDSVDEKICDAIVHTFPGLRNLQLFSEVWSAQLPEVATSLSALPFLKLFQSDYNDDEFTSPPEQVTWTRRYRDLLPVLGAHCRALEYIGFYSREIYWSFFEIKRDERGLIEAYVEGPHEYGTSRLNATSAWDARRYRFI